MHTVLSHAFGKFSSKRNISISFKTLLTSDSNVLFLWFETAINRITSSPKNAMANIYIMLK